MTKPVPDPLDPYAPRRDPDGEYKKQCPVCGTDFRTNNARTIYDTLECRKHARFQRYYQRNREHIITAVIARRKERS